MLDLCDRCCGAIDRAPDDKHVVVTRSGQPVAELRSLHRKSPDLTTLLDRCHHLPHVDPDEIRRDIDQFIEPSLLTVIRPSPHYGAHPTWACNYLPCGFGTER